MSLGAAHISARACQLGIVLLPASERAAAPPPGKENRRADRPALKCEINFRPFGAPVAAVLLLRRACARCPLASAAAAFRTHLLAARCQNKLPPPSLAPVRPPAPVYSTGRAGPHGCSLMSAAGGPRRPRDCGPRAGRRLLGVAQALGSSLGQSA